MTFEIIFWTVFSATMLVFPTGLIYCDNLESEREPSSKFVFKKVATKEKAAALNNGCKNESGSSYLKCVGQFCLPIDYDKLAMPHPLPRSICNNSEKSKHTAAVDIKLDFDFRVYEVDDIRYTVSFTMYFGVRCTL